MSGFAATNKRLQTIGTRLANFPLDPMRLIRMTYHLQKALRDKTGVALKPFELADPAYMVLAVLYGSPNETSSASELSEACYEKPANLTRVCDDLKARGLICRGDKEGDRRLVMISLTDAGRALIEQALPAVGSKVATAYESLSKAEMKQFADLFERVLTKLDE
ncbi:MAG: MarR family transcriptional regulator [Massilia sp.]|nr:MarR family transcriptional regulator [Massilia sp.]